jgi:ribonuclease-3
MFPNVEAKAIEIESLTGYTFINKRLAVEAVQMASTRIAAVYDNKFDSAVKNTRLSILGDAVLASLLCGIWFNTRDRHSEADHFMPILTWALTESEKLPSEAQWTQLRNDLISNAALARRGYEIGIDWIVTVGSNNPAMSGRMVATTLEAIIGAVQQDGGDDAVNQAIEHLELFDHALLTVTFRPIRFPP